MLFKHVIVTHYIDTDCHVIFLLQGTPVKDVVIPESAPKSLLVQKHADYIAAYGLKKDDYVSIWLSNKALTERLGPPHIIVNNQSVQKLWMDRTLLTDWLGNPCFRGGLRCTVLFITWSQGEHLLSVVHHPLSIFTLWKLYWPHILPNLQDNWSEHFCQLYFFLIKHWVTWGQEQGHYIKLKGNLVNSLETTHIAWYK